ncbi:SMR family transporter [Arthrobacter sp.]|uniref:DMT family transporter n=1 Tax=Arthrobacter sp. TaxID=1667 RepID=UPI0033922D1F
MGWVFLAGAILSEVSATLSLRAAINGGKAWYVLVATGYPFAFFLLSAALNVGIGLGVAYGIWAAVGVALTALASRWIFKEPITRVMAAGILLIMAGVILIETGSAH